MCVVILFFWPTPRCLGRIVALLLPLLSAFIHSVIALAFLIASAML